MRRPLLALLLAAALLACDAPPPVEPTDSPTPPSVTSSPERDREEILSLAVTGLLEQHHLTRHPLDDTVSEEAFALYLQRLDPARIFLLQSDVDALGAQRRGIDDAIQKGHLELAGEAWDRLSKASTEVEHEVTSLLTGPLDLTTTDTLELDASRRPWCADAGERRARLSAVLRYQLITTLAREQVAGTLPPDQTPARQAELQRELAADWSGRLTRMRDQDHLQRIDALLNAVIATWDPHSAFLPPRRQATFQVELTGTSVGVGIELEVSGHWARVSLVRPNSSAWREGTIRAGDLIVAIAPSDGPAVDLRDKPLDAIHALLEGEAGSTVLLSVRKPDGSTRAVRLVRAVVEHTENFARAALIGKNPHPTGYLAIPRFYGRPATAAPDDPAEHNSAADTERLLNALDRGHAQTLVLDLRGNEGGLFEDAVRIAGYFLPASPIVQAQTADGQVRVLADDDPTVLWPGPLVVLVDAHTASAAEVLAAALQDHGRAVIVGDTTCGKGTVQQLVDLDAFITSTKIDAIRPLGLFKLTSQQYFRVTGASTQHRGIEPDIRLPAPDAHLDTRERTLPHALPWSARDPVPFERWTHAPKLDDLRARSSTRTDRDPVLGALAQQADVRRATSTHTTRTLSLNAEIDRLRAEDTAITAVWKGVPTRAWTTATPIGPDLSRPVLREAWVEALEQDAWLREAVGVLADLEP